MAFACDDSIGRVVVERLHGLMKSSPERVLSSPQGPIVAVEGISGNIINMCSNNYLGLAGDSRVVQGAKNALDTRGFGMASARFICGTQDIHKSLEMKISAFHEMEDAVVYTSGFDANAGLFEPFVFPEDAVIVDEESHNSLFCGIKLCKATKLHYHHLSMADLELKLKEAQSQRVRYVITDALFPKSGELAPLDDIVALCEKYDAFLIVDDSHGVGCLGQTGRGCIEHFGVVGKVPLVTCSLGKAFGGGTGGYVAGRRDAIEILRQRSRTLLFAITVSPGPIGACIAAFDALSTDGTALRDTLEKKTVDFRKKLKAVGFKLKGKDHVPLIPVLFGTPLDAEQGAKELLETQKVLVLDVSGEFEGCIRLQVTTLHSDDQLEQCVSALVSVAQKRQLVGFFDVPCSSRAVTNSDDGMGRVLSELVGSIKAAGTYKTERIIISPQCMEIKVEGTEKPVLNFCSNDYLGLCNHPAMIEAAKEHLDRYGYGCASQRDVSGTMDLHKILEKKICQFHQTEDAILFGSCFDANYGLFNAFLSEKDAVISDALNHASIIDGVRLCACARYRMKHSDMEDLEKLLVETKDKHRIRVVVTDAIFSMDGDIAPLKEMLELCEKYHAYLAIDDAHGAGWFGKTGRGTPEYCGVLGRIPIITSTLGKAIGGAHGGYLTGRKDIVEAMRHYSAPYVNTTSPSPPIVGAMIKAFDMMIKSTELRDNLERNIRHFREKMAAAGFTIAGAPECAICPVMLGDAKLSVDFSDAMLKRNIYVIGFSYPVVPKETARIRVQLSNSFTMEALDRAISAFVEVGKEFGVIH